MRIAMLTTDSRQEVRHYALGEPAFGTAPQALLEGFAMMKGVEIHVVSCLQQPVTSPAKLASNIWFHPLHVPKLGWLRTGYQGCIRAVRAKLREIQPAIVHGQGTERDCAISAVFSGFPNVITIHGNMAELAHMFGARLGSYGWCAARLEHFTLPRTAGVFCNSAYTEGLIRPRARKVWRVANPLRREIFERPFPARNSPDPHLVNVGVVSPRKRQLELLTLAERLHRQGFSGAFHFVGAANPQDPYAAAFLERVKVAETAGYARYLGTLATAALIDLYDRSAALIHFPSEEAFGLVVAEALTRNLKVFGARVGGVSDIAHSIPGTELFPPDDWAGLESALLRWGENGFAAPPSSASLMRERYHPEVIACHHLEIYREVLSTCS